MRGSLFKDSELIDPWVGPKNEPFKARDWVQLGWRQGFYLHCSSVENRARENKRPTLRPEQGLRPSACVAFSREV